MSCSPAAQWVACVLRIARGALLKESVEAIAVSSRSMPRSRRKPHIGADLCKIVARGTATGLKESRTDPHRDSYEGSAHET
eukprot:3610261-Pleurochrysis_carterae.AAC.3